MYSGDFRLDPPGTLDLITADLVRTETRDRLVSSSTPPVDFIFGLGTKEALDASDGGRQYILELKPTAVRTGADNPNYIENVEWALNNNFQVLFPLGYAGSCGSPTTVAGRNCYAARAAKHVERFGTSVMYEMWNEWDGGFGLPGGYAVAPANDTALYTDILCRTYNAIKNKNQDAQFVGAVQGGASASWLQGILNAGAADCMDIYCTHLYVYRPNWPGHVDPLASGDVGVNKFIQTVNNVNNQIIAHTGRSIPMILSEVGYNGQEGAAGEQVAADYLTRLYTRVPNEVPFVKGIWWFTLREQTTGFPFGLMRRNYEKKPAFFAYKNVVPN